MQQQQTNQAIPDNLLPSHTFQFLLGDLKAFRGQTRYIFFQCVLGLSVERAHQTSTGRRPGGILTRPKPPQPVSWNTHVAQSTASAPQSLLRSELLSWAYLSHPVEETQSTILLFQSLPILHDHSWGLDLSTQQVTASPITADTAPTHIPPSCHSCIKAHDTWIPFLEVAPHSQTTDDTLRAPPWKSKTGLKIRSNPDVVKHLLKSVPPEAPSNSAAVQWK